MSDDFSAVCGALVPPLYSVVSARQAGCAGKSTNVKSTFSNRFYCCTCASVHAHHTTHVVSLEGTARPAASQGDLALGNKLTKTITVHYQP